MPRELLDTRAAAKILGVKPATLRSWRHRGKGPPFKRATSNKFSSCVYTPEEVELWKLDNPRKR